MPLGPACLRVPFRKLSSSVLPVPLRISSAQPLPPLLLRRLSSRMLNSVSRLPKHNVLLLRVLLLQLIEQLRKLLSIVVWSQRLPLVAAIAVLLLMMALLAALATAARKAAAAMFPVMIRSQRGSWEAWSS